MKARIPRVNKKQMTAIKSYVGEELAKQEKDRTRRMIKLFCVALHQEFGFGLQRCLKGLEKFNEFGGEREQDEVFWTHIDRVIEQIGLTFPKEDYEDMDK